MKAFFILSLFLATATGAFAQRQNVYFLKNNGKYVNLRDSADYIRIVREPDSTSKLYNVFEYYTNGTNKLVGKSITIDPPRYEEQCITFYPNGKKESITMYKNAQKSGDRFEYYPNGQIYQVLTYPEPLTGDEVPKSTKGPGDRGGDNDYQIKTNNDSLGNALVTDGNGYYKGYNDKFTYIEEEGSVKNGKRDGVWKGNYQNIGTTFTENYSNGELVDGTAITKEGKTGTYSKSRMVFPQFKGGIAGFGRFLSNKINYPDEARKIGIEGRVILSFVVEKDGSLTDIKVTKSVDPLLDNEAVRVLNSSPKWVPGTQFGLPARVKYSVPVAFALR